MRSEIFWFIQSGFNEFAWRTKSPLFKAQWSVKLVIQDCVASIWIIYLLKNGMFFTMNWKFSELICFLLQFLLRQLDTSVADAPLSTLFSPRYQIIKTVFSETWCLWSTVAIAPFGTFHLSNFSEENHKLLFFHYLGGSCWTQLLK